jgi:hypothetical protein
MNACDGDTPSGLCAHANNPRGCGANIHHSSCGRPDLRQL